MRLGCRRCHWSHAKLTRIEPLHKAVDVRATNPDIAQQAVIHGFKRSDHLAPLPLADGPGQPTADRIAFAGYFGVGLNSFSGNLREAQTTGTLEAMLMTPTSLRTIILSSSLYDYGFVTIQVFVYLILGVALFGVELNGNVPAALAILVLTIVAMTAVGIMAASFIMVLKRGDPVTWLFNSIGLCL